MELDEEDIGGDFDQIMKETLTMNMMTISLLRMKKSPHLVKLMMRIMMKRMMLRIGIIGQEVMEEPMQRNLPYLRQDPSYRY